MMKSYTTVTCAILVLVIFPAVVWSQSGTCGGECVFSDECATEYGDNSCRCSYFRCRKYPAGECGGGCVHDGQCREWSENNESCLCGSLFECRTAKELESSEYKAFANFMLSARGAYYQKKMEKMVKIYQSEQKSLQGNSEEY